MVVGYVLEHLNYKLQNEKQIILDTKDLCDIGKTIVFPIH